MRIDQFIMTKSALERLSDVLLLVGLDGSVLDANPAGLRCYGRTHTEMLGLSVDDIRGPHYQGNHDSQVRMAAEHGVLLEEEHRHRDGSLFPVEVWLATVGVDGEEALLAVVRDISERKAADSRLQSALDSTIEVICNLSEVRDPYTAGHQRGVSELSSAIAVELGMSECDIADTRIAGLMHDVGKMSVPAEILSRPGELSASELSLVRDHAEVGYQIISAARMHGPIPELVHQHHERCDGSGYPRGIAGDQLLEGSKVLMVADVVEAMMSHRPYRPACGKAAALDEIARGAGSRYDPCVAEVCVRVFREHDFTFSEFGPAGGC